MCCPCTEFILPERISLPSLWETPCAYLDILPQITSAMLSSPYVGYSQGASLTPGALPLLFLAQELALSFLSSQAPPVSLYHCFFHSFHKCSQLSSIHSFILVEHLVYIQSRKMTNSRLQNFITSFSMGSKSIEEHLIAISPHLPSFLPLYFSITRDPSWSSSVS